MVAVGTWAGGEEIPRVRALAADLRISVITIKRAAYLELETEGIVVTRQGRGKVIANTPRVTQPPSSVLG